MKQYILALITIGSLLQLQAQTTTEVIPYSNDSRVITTAVPFLLIASDARAAGMGDLGVATSPDAYSQQWNPAKYGFSEAKSGIAISYTPYLSKLVNDIFLGNLTYYNRINERSAFAASFKYFSLGEIEIVQDEFSEALIEQPNELTIDASYTLRLADQFSMGVALRYLRSDLRIQAVDANASAASTFGVDIAGFYQSEEEAYDAFNGRWRGGFAIQNLGPKIKYDDAGRENFIPTNLRLGGGFEFIFDEYNSLSVNAEVTKLLVPTPPVLGREIEFEDVNNNGTYEEDEDNFIGETDNVIIEGKSNDVNFLKGMFQSFGDAPGGFSEEIKEFTWALGTEYKYQDSFALRAGYFNESEEKGARKFFALGAGFKYTTINIDVSYLFSASKIQSPLENTLRFSLTFNFGDGEYDEY
ncbi:MAG: type IX secretion system outer membrane channel protein PorV [Bacteroidia bacterium]|nr:type IX secretion system outer membrane channel protein PorV [Bacteroidia bacterium]MBT8269080.1 type IX secretion system outer membrane channel protein PorV [Bacteroidia bacterium]NNF81955.1 type IX secretion system outer membrane channel protein PorV [Flavobacteriaceae bacterium]NNK69849.1 type IX secretion system outer membrane channel protein PorV [Flavobacteriaceae bacterium]NNL81053.1 type IX secretion system outer membrane channel protein PorV [Flavobacteriaceae bacterium]